MYTDTDNDNDDDVTVDVVSTVDYLMQSHADAPFVALSIQAQLCKELMQKLPRNDFGLPPGIYRPDLLPNVDAQAALDAEDSAPPQDIGEYLGMEQQSLLIGELFDEDETPKARDLVPAQRSLLDNLSTQEVQAAYVPLLYDEGYPTLPQGMPVWSRLPFESPTAYEVFQLYLRMSHESGLGVRMLSELPRFTSLHAVQVSMANIHEYYHLFYWGVRAKSFDMVQTASLQKQQELRALNVQNDHYRLSDKLLSKLKTFMDDEEDFWDMMTPKTAVDLLKTTTTLQRVSAGLPASGPPQHREGNDPRGSSFEVILRQIAQKSSVQHTTTHEDNSSTLLGDILSDPEMIVHAQELILRMNKHG